jgi:hypothetical protein
MNFDVTLRIGRTGPSYTLPSLFLDAAGIGPVCDIAGSYQIAAMGDQFSEYVLQPLTVLLPPAPAFAPHPAYARLPGKLRATSISGNIGEAVAAHWGVAHLQLTGGQIVHIKTTPGYGHRRSPDYLMQIGVSMLQSLPSTTRDLLAPPIRQALLSAPDWWPVEAKSRESDNSEPAAFRKAFRQIVAYWHTIQGVLLEVGYGVIVNFTSLARRQILISLLLPSNQLALLSRLAVPRNAAQLRAYINGADADAPTTATLHGF